MRRSFGAFTIVPALLLALLALAPQIAGAQQVNLPAPASVRVAHLSPDAPAVSVYIDGQRTFSSVDYATTSQAQDIAPGRHRVQVSLASDTAEQAVVDTTVDLIRGKPYTLALTGSLSELKASLLSDSVRGLPRGLARVRFIHAAPTTGPVDVWPSNSAAPVLTDEYFGQVDAIDVEPGTYTFRFNTAGTSGALLTSQELRFEPGWSYTVALTGSATDSSAPLIAHVTVDQIGR